MSKEFNYIVRLQGTNLDGTKTVPYALCEIKGVGIRLALSIIKTSGIDATMRLGNLSDADVKRLEEALDDPIKIGLPNWIVNRRKDPMTGNDLHLLGSDLDFKLREDIELMRETRSWKGERHARGIKVRGQHTKTTARKGRSVGVSKKQQQQAQQAQPRE